MASNFPDICVLYRGAPLYVLRPKENATYQFVGDAFTHGLMELKSSELKHKLDYSDLMSHAVWDIEGLLVRLLWFFESNSRLLTRLTVPAEACGADRFFAIS